MIVGGGKSSKLAVSGVGEGIELVDGFKVGSRVVGPRLVGLAFAGLEVGAKEGTAIGEGLAVIQDAFHVIETRIPVMSLVEGAMIIISRPFGFEIASSH